MRRRPHLRDLRGAGDEVGERAPHVPVPALQLRAHRGHLRLELVRGDPALEPRLAPQRGRDPPEEAQHLSLHLNIVTINTCIYLSV